MLVAGVDVGNSTTEIVVARVEPGAEPAWLFVDRVPTTGPKGSAACVPGVANLLGRAERRLGERPHLLLLAELHPVESELVELSRREELALGRTAIARPSSETPSGVGVSAGTLTPLAALSNEPAPGPVVVLVADVDFDAAAAALREARTRGWIIAGAIVERDDAVLIGNRFDRALPIVDEVADVDRLPLGALAAVEVAEPGGSVEHLADPLRLGVLLGFGPDEARAARHASRAVAGHRAAIVVKAPTADAVAGKARKAGITLVGADGVERLLDERAEPPPPGEVVAMRGSAGNRNGLLDVVWRLLPVPPAAPGGARRRSGRRARAPAGPATGAGGRLLESLAGLCSNGARVVAREADASLLGASTTPSAGKAPFVVDLGGGTVDLHRAGTAVSTAGAGDLVTRICSAVLGCDVSLAEWAKRRRSARVETPFSLHHEDGSRTFLGEPAPAAALARLCLLDGGALVPLPAPLAPEVWRDLRRRAKRAVIARNVRRAIEALDGVPRGELVMLVGGSACDGEVVDAVAVELADLDVAVARGDVLGRHGPRAAVAVGLVLAFAAGGER